MDEDTVKLDPRLQARLDTMDSVIEIHRDSLATIDKGLKILAIRLETAERTAMGLLHLLKSKGSFSRTEYKALKAFVSGDPKPLKPDAGNGSKPDLWMPE